MIKIISIALVLLSSCSTLKNSDKEMTPSYLNDPITVDTAIRLAHAAFLKSCVTHSSLGFQKCKQSADLYVKEDILAIMDQ